MTLKRFRNINYPYKDQDDTFIARGYHLNVLVDDINNLHVGFDVVPIDAAGTTDVILGRSKDIDAAFIDYKAIFPDVNIGSNLDQAGTLEVSNSSEAILPDLSWTRESTNHTVGAELTVTIEFLIVGADLVMRLTNTSSYTMNFTYTAKIVSYAS